MRAVREHGDQPASIAIRQGLEQDGIQNCEDGGVGTDAQGQRQDRDARKSGRTQQPPQAVLQVFPELFQPGNTARVTMQFFHLLYSSVSQPCFPPRLFRSAAALLQIFFH